MVKHIVLFKLKDEVPADEKLVAMNNFKKAIEALPAKISVIRKIEVGLNINPAETWSIALYSEFDTLDDVNFCLGKREHYTLGYGTIRQELEKYPSLLSKAKQACKWVPVNFACVATGFRSCTKSTVLKGLENCATK